MLCAICMIVLGLIFMAQLNCFLGILVLKFQDISLFLMIKYNIVALITGTMIPLTLLPAHFVSAMRIFPFYYVTYLPSMLLIGRNSGEASVGLMVFRLSFFGAFFVDGSLFLLQLLMFGAIYTQVDSIGGWTQGQMLIFVGTFSLINALNMVVFFFGVIGIPDKIKSGSLDYYLTKPANPLLRLIFEEVSLGSVPLIFLSIGIIIYGVSVQGVYVTPLLCVEYGIFVLLMTLLWYDTELILRTISFL